MRSQRNKKHTIDLLFPIALFFVLAVSSLIVVLLASNVYRNTTRMEQSNYESRTALSYVVGKIHQNDEQGSVALGSFPGKRTCRRQCFGNLFKICIPLCFRLFALFKLCGMVLYTGRLYPRQQHFCIIG